MYKQRYEIILTERYKEDMITIKEKSEKNYYTRFKERSDVQISYLSNMPRMYQRLYLKQKMNR